MFDPYHKWLGIRSERKPPNHYQLLGISPIETDLEVIEEAFIRQTTHLRTYQNGPQALVCTQVLNELAKAHVTLTDPVKRKEYDAELEEERAYQVRAKIKPFSAPLAGEQMSAPVTSPPPKVRKPKKHKQSDYQYESYRGKSKMPIIPIVAGAVVLAVIVVVVIVLLNNSGGPTSSTDQAHRGDRAKDTPSSRKPPEPDPQPPANPPPDDPPPQRNRPHEDSPPPRRPVEEEPKRREQPPAPPVKKDDPPPPAVEPEKPDNKEPPPDLSKVDLLKLVSPPKSRHIVEGPWRMVGKALVSPISETARLQIPYRPPDEYDLRIVAERKQGPDCVVIGLPLPHFRTFMNLDAGNTVGYYSGLQVIDGLSMRMRNEGKVMGPVIVRGRPNTILVKVRRQSITIIVNNRTIVHFTGDLQRLKCGDGWEGPMEGVFILGSWNTSYHFSAIELTPVSGPGKVVE